MSDDNEPLDAPDGSQAVAPLYGEGDAVTRQKMQKMLESPSTVQVIARAEARRSQEGQSQPVALTEPAAVPQAELEAPKVLVAAGVVETVAGERVKRLPAGDPKQATLVGKAKTPEEIDEFKEKWQLQATYAQKGIELDGDAHEARQRELDAGAAAYAHHEAAKRHERRVLEEQKRHKAQAAAKPAPLRNILAGKNISGTAKLQHEDVKRAVAEERAQAEPTASLGESSHGDSEVPISGARERQIADDTRADAESAHALPIDSVAGLPRKPNHLVIAVAVGALLLVLVATSVSLLGDDAPETSAPRPARSAAAEPSRHEPAPAPKAATPEPTGPEATPPAPSAPESPVPPPSAAAPNPSPVPTPPPVAPAPVKPPPIQPTVPRPAAPKPTNPIDPELPGSARPDFD